MNIREALPAFLIPQTDLVPLIAGRVFPGMRPQGSETNCIVFRVTRGLDDGAIDGDTKQRDYTVELVAWAKDLVQAVRIGDVLKTLFHGTGDFLLGELSIDEAWKVDEYDGDRVTDTYADAGDYPITYVFNFRWVEA